MAATSPRSRPLLRALLVQGGVVLLAAWPTWAWAGNEGLAALGVAAGVGLLGWALGRVPHLFFRRGPDALFHASLAGLGLRLLGTLAVAAPLMLLSPLPLAPFAVGLVLSYFALLVLEVLELVAAARALAPEAGSREEARPGPDGAKEQ